VWKPEMWASVQRRKNGLLYRRRRKLGVLLTRKGGTGNRGITAELYIKLRRRLGLEHTKRKMNLWATQN